MKWHQIHTVCQHERCISGAAVGAFRRVGMNSPGAKLDSSAEGWMGRERVGAILLQMHGCGLDSTRKQAAYSKRRRCSDVVEKRRFSNCSKPKHKDVTCSWKSSVVSPVEMLIWVSGWSVSRDWLQMTSRWPAARPRPAICPQSQRASVQGPPQFTGAAAAATLKKAEIKYISCTTSTGRWHICWVPASHSAWNVLRWPCRWMLIKHATRKRKRPFIIHSRCTRWWKCAEAAPLATWELPGLNQAATPVVCKLTPAWTGATATSPPGEPLTSQGSYVINPRLAFRRFLPRKQLLSQLRFFRLIASSIPCFKYNFSTAHEKHLVCAAAAANALACEAASLFSSAKQGRWRFLPPFEGPACLFMSQVQGCFCMRGRVWVLVLAEASSCCSVLAEVKTKPNKSQL